MKPEGESLSAVLKACSRPRCGRATRIPKVPFLWQAGFLGSDIRVVFSSRHSMPDREGALKSYLWAFSATFGPHSHSRLKQSWGDLWGKEIRVPPRPASKPSGLPGPAGLLALRRGGKRQQSTAVPAQPEAKKRTGDDERVGTWLAKV